MVDDPSRDRDAIVAVPSTAPLDDYQKLLLQADREESSGLDRHLGVTALAVFPISVGVCGVLATIAPGSAYWLATRWTSALLSPAAIGASKVSGQPAIR